LGGAFINKKPIGVSWEFESIVTFCWLSCDSLLLAGLLLGKEEIFLHPSGFSLLGMQGKSLQGGSAKGYSEWYGMRAPPSGLLPPF